VIERIWMHVGAEKTGTTSLQHWLMLNREALGQRGILFPHAPGQFNHIALAAHALEASKGMEELRITCGAGRFGSVAAFRRHLEAELARETAGTDATQVVFSNEHCSSRLRTADEIERLRDLLYRIADDVRIVLYIREPAAFFASWYSTAIASGGTGRFPARPGPDLLKAADWLTMARMWGDAFGSGSVTLRRFDRAHLAGGDVIADFCALLGLDPGAFAPASPRNESLGLVPLLFLRRLNATLPRIVDGAFNPERGNIVDVLRSFPDPRRFVLPAETAALVRAHYAESYELLARIHFPADDGPLFATGAPPAAVPQTLTEEDLLAVARHLWVNRKGARGGELARPPEEC